MVEEFSLNDRLDTDLRDAIEKSEALARSLSRMDAKTDRVDLVH